MSDGPNPPTESWPDVDALTVIISTKDYILSIDKEEDVDYEKALLEASPVRRFRSGN